MARRGTRVTYLLPRLVDIHVATQRYFVLGLDEVADLRIADEPIYTRPFRRGERKVRAALHASEIFRRSRVPALRPRPGSGACGRYVVDDGHMTARFAIDCGDSPEIYDPSTLEWSDVYFKANYWPSARYEEKVCPLVNASGLLDAAGIARLRGLRDHPKDLDVSFVVNVWGGREHNVRLFEQLARLEARTELHAIFIPGYDPEETRTLRRRLEGAGVRCSDRPIPLAELWHIQARSRLVFFRSGKHLCLPWRTVDLLGMGACIVADAAPLPEWYVPLRAGENFVDCGIRRPLDTSAGPAEDYERIVPTIEALLTNDARVQAIRRSNARYFDDVAAPERVAEHILSTLRTRVPGLVG